jgi:peroxiredoxin
MSRALGPEDFLDRPLPDFELPDQHGTTFRSRDLIGRRPLALFFYILNGSPG